MNIFFAAKMKKANSNKNIQFGILRLQQDDKLQWMYTYHEESQFMLSRMQKYNPGVYYYIDALLEYKFGQTIFNFKPEYFNQPMTAEEAYEHLLCSPH